MIASSSESYAEPEDELVQILAGKRKPIATSFTDLPLLAELSADCIIAAFAAQELIANSESPLKDDLSVYIYTLICKSGCDIFAIVTALSLIDEYLLMLFEVGESVLYTVDEACRLFLVASMALAKPLRADEKEHISFWMGVSDGEYHSAELCLMEQDFMKLLQIGPEPENLEPEDDDENESFWFLKESPKVDDGKLKTEEIPCMDAEDERQFTLSFESSASPMCRG